MQAEILSIGDEITSGRRLDTNSQWLSQRCEELGIRVLYHTTVGDDLDALVSVFRQAFRRVDVVIATGGLGPTADDLSRQAIADALGQPLVLDEQALQHVRQLFARRKRPMPTSNEVQALLPRGSRMIPNPHGTAPGIAADAPRPDAAPCRVFLLPGVPAEMMEMWRQSVAESLRSQGAARRVILHRQIHTFGAGESHVEAMLPDLIHHQANPRVGITASQATITLRIAAEGPDEKECLDLIQPTVALIRCSLGNLVFGEDDEQLQHAVVKLLRRRNQTLATCEWGTAGLVAQWLHDLSDARDCCLGSIVVSCRAALERTLDMPGQATVPSDGGSELVRLMATHCRQRFGADIALAVGPFPAVDPAGAELEPVYFGLATASGVMHRSIPFAAHPALLKTYCAKHALNFLRLAMQEKGSGAYIDECGGSG